MKISTVTIIIIISIESSSCTSLLLLHYTKLREAVINTEN